MSKGAFDRIADAVLAKRSALVLGLDPRPERMPLGYGTDGEGVVRFHARLIELLAPHVVAVKPQIAFFEVLGEDGLWTYAETCRRARDAGLVVIGDVKRGDIDSTAEAYAAAHFAWADVLTVNPYLGEDAVAPFLERCGSQGKGVFVLCATSNPGWRQFQGATLADGRHLFEAVADAIATWNARFLGGGAYGPVGAVVGATHPEVLASVRERLPASWLLTPGVGAQGARIAGLRAAFDARGLGVLVPVSRALAGAFAPDDSDWEARVTAGAEQLLDEMRASVPGLDGA